MSLLEFIKRKKLERNIKKAKWDEIGATARGHPEALARLGKAYAKAEKFKAASITFKNAAQKASRMEVTKPLSKELNRLANRYHNIHEKL